jgi:Na+-driven multidrug efflux pump
MIGVFSAVMVIVAEVLAIPLAKIFVRYDAALLDLTVSGFRIYALSFLFMGYAIFGSGFFTALNDGVTSAIISFLRTLVFQVAAVLLLPLIWDINGIWYSVVVAELMAIVISAVFLVKKKKKYHY